jgi:hypothetical protein
MLSRTCIVTIGEEQTHVRLAPVDKRNRKQLLHGPSPAK